MNYLEASTSLTDQFMYFYRAHIFVLNLQIINTLCISVYEIHSDSNKLFITRHSSRDLF